MLLIGVFPPVLAFTLLLPYPPKAGSAPKQPPTKFATPSATSSRFGLSAIPWMPSFWSPPPKLFAATDDSKNPRSAIRKDVPIASRTWCICDVWNGQWNGNALPDVDLTSPRISRPCDAQSNRHERIAETTTTRKRSGMYATPGYLGCRRFLSSL
jgi:hypothetical protein